MCWNRALLVHHISSQCAFARRVCALRIARKHARGEILCRRLEWEQGAVSSRVASLLRSAEAKPMFYRFVRSSGPSPLHRPMEVCTIRPAPAARAQGARPGARAAARRRPPPPAAASRARRPPTCPSTTQIHSTRLHAHSRARAWAAAPMEVCIIPTTCYLPRVPQLPSAPSAARRRGRAARTPPHSPSSTAHTHVPPSAATEP